MLRSQNIVAQSICGVKFGTDIRTRRIEYATYGGEDSAVLNPLADDSLIVTILWAICNIARKLGAWGWRKDNANEYLCGYVDKYVRNATADLGMLGKKGINSEHFIADCISQVWENLHKYKQYKQKSFLGGIIDIPTQTSFASWIYWRVRLQKRRYMERRERGNREKDLNILIQEVGGLESIGPLKLFGLAFEPSDDSTGKGGVHHKWTRMSCKGVSKEEGPVERTIAKDDKKELDAVLKQLPQKDRNVLWFFFVKGYSTPAIAERRTNVTDDNGEWVPMTDKEVKALKDAPNTKMGVQKQLVRVLNVIRHHYGISGDVVSLGGKKREIITVDTTEPAAVELAAVEPARAYRAKPLNGYVSPFGLSVKVADNPQASLRQSLSAGLSPRFADYVRKVRGNGFTVLVAD